MKALIHGFRHYADFSGRDRCGKFWGFIFSCFIISLLLMLPVVLTGLQLITALIEALIQKKAAAPAEGDMLRHLLSQSIVMIICMILMILWWLATLIPTAAATVRRLRDAGQSPWWVLPPLFTCTPLSALTSGLGAWPWLLSMVTLILCCLPTKTESST